MAHVVHTIKNNQYLYNHHRVGDKIVSDYIGPVGSGGVIRTAKHGGGAPSKVTQQTPNIDPYSIPLKQMWDNTELHEQYKEGTDASYLKNKHYLTWGRDSKLYIHIVEDIPINKIKKTSEDLKHKKPVYEKLKTQAPPVDVTKYEDGTFRIYNGHRRLKSAIARGDTHIFAEYIIQADSYKLK